MRFIIKAVACAFAAFNIDAAIAGETPVGEAQPPALTAKAAGARYGQALGAAEICIGWTATAKAADLSHAYSGQDLEDFKVQTAKVLDAWVKVKGCNKPADPNECKIIMDKSCAAATAEIGPAGSVMPGLLDPPRK